MIEPRELRIGNLIAYNGRPDQVIHLTNQHIETFVGPEEPLLADSDSWSPIPLTTEWLERFGFEKYKDYDEGELMRHGKVLLTKKFALRYSDTNDDWYYSTAIVLQYVHQLQNLYFALTGTELDLKP